MGPAEKVREMIGEAVSSKIDEKLAEMNGKNGSDEQVAKENEVRMNNSRPTPEWKADETGGRSLRIELFTDEGRNLYTKSIDQSTSVPGSPVPSLGVWQEPHKQPIFRMLAQYQDVGTGSSFKTSKLSGITVTNRTSEASERSSYGGELAATTHSLENREATVRFSRNAGDDLRNLYEQSVEGIVGALDETINEKFVGLIKTSVLSSTAGTAASTTTGGAKTRSSTSNVLTHLSGVLKPVPARYRPGGKFLVSTDLFETLSQAVSSGGEWALRPAGMDGGLTLWGYGVSVSDDLPTTAANDDLKACFVSPASCLLGVRSDVMINEHLDTFPGSILLIGNTRIKEVLLDPLGCSGLVVGA